MECNSGWCIECCFLEQTDCCYFQIRQDTQVKTVSRSEVENYVSRKQIREWIATNSDGGLKTIDEYIDFLLNENTAMDLFWGDEKLLTHNCHCVRAVFSKCPIATRVDLKDILRNNDEVVTFDIDDSGIYKADAIECVISAAMAKNLQRVIDKQMSVEEFDAAASVAEGMGILSSIWNYDTGKIYIRARINEYTFAQLVKISAVPGTIRSSVLRQCVKNTVHELDMIKYSVKWDVGISDTAMNGCVIPSSHDLAQWIGIGLLSVTEEQSSGQIIFTRVGRTKLLNCLKMYNFRHSQHQDYIGILVSGTRLVVWMEQMHKSISQDVVDVWQFIWKGFQHMICMNEPVRTCRVLMHIKYLLCIRDQDYHEWKKAWKCLVFHNANIHLQWSYLIKDVMLADKLNNNYFNTDDKNACILQGIRVMCCIVDDLSVIEHVVEWLYNVNHQNTDAVSQEIVWNIDQIETVPRRFEFVLSVFKYYVFKCLKPSEALKGIFVQYLGLQL